MLHAYRIIQQNVWICLLAMPYVSARCHYVWLLAQFRLFWKSRLSNFPRHRLSKSKAGKRKNFLCQERLPRKHFVSVLLFFRQKKKVSTKITFLFREPELFIVVLLFRRRQDGGREGGRCWGAAFIVVISTSAHKSVSRKCKTNCSQFNKF